MARRSSDDHSERTCTVELPDATVVTVAVDTPLQTLLAPFDQNADDPIVAALLNGEALDLSAPVEVGGALSAITLGTDAGIRCYRQSLCFLLAHAVIRADASLHLVIGHSLGNGYYYSFTDAVTDQQTLDRVAAEMESIVKDDRPITRTILSHRDAVHYFSAHGMDETVLLLRHRNDPRVCVHSCDGFLDVAHGPLVPRTGLLSRFALQKLDHGFVLRYPPHAAPQRLDEYRHSPVLYATYQEYKEWGRILGVTSAGRLNQTVVDGTVSSFVRVNEALHEKKIADIAAQIRDRSDRVRAVLIAGPSSSGKTTFTKKLALQLSAQGLLPILLSVDNYFVDRDRTPRDEHGEYDFESLRAIDVDQLNEHLVGILAGRATEIPRYDFKSGSRTYRGDSITLSDTGVLLVEGIHCLNDALTERIPREQKFKVYISALTQLNLDDRNRISTTDNRLIRRMVRDHQFRGHSAETTLLMWPSVRRGERISIFPFQDTADVAFNSALDYEIGVLRKHAEPLLRRVTPDSVAYPEARRVLAFMDNFTNIPDKYVPEYSILREFIGDSGFHY